MRVVVDLSDRLMDTIVVPVGGKDDAISTSESLLPYLDETTHVIVVYVVEKAGGAPDKASVEQREEYAEDLFGLIERKFMEEGRDPPESKVLYGTDVPEAVFGFADEAGASSVVFVPRSSGLLDRTLTGDVAYSLITENNIPVVVLPSRDT